LEAVAEEGTLTSDERGSAEKKDQEKLKGARFQVPFTVTISPPLGCIPAPAG
jgi:hypothetical protein